MIDKLWCYHNGVRGKPMTLEQIFGWNIRFQILCDTRAQKDYLTAMQLMFSREVQINTWEEWKRRKATVPLDEFPYDRIPDRIDDYHYTATPPLLPIYFSTSAYNGAESRTWKW